ncbi:TolC family protein [Roseibaca sp. V10]|uniref:TolC family protein n=1 Tax=Roseinatronobacter domitianus TaxID=2940293 RepID=A0ABT0M3V0_9RHOB|nr:TolC family protein [Roseibaca domitiana]MCL1629535.1 TolC family protein [Roseibaca domitiana]
MRPPLTATILAATLLTACVTPPDLTALETAVVTREARLPASLADGVFGKAVAQAVTSSPTLGRGEAALRAAEANLLAEGGAFLPQITVGLRPEDTSGFGVTSFGAISQLLYDGGASAGRETAARARVLGGLAGRLDAGSRATLSSVEAWAGVATAGALLRVSETSLASLEATTAQIEERSSAGLGSSVDALTARSRLANERAAVVAARSEVTRADAIFIEVFGQAPTPGLSLPPQAPRAPEAGAEGSPTLRRAEAEVLAAEAEHTAALAGRVPSLSVSVSAIPGGSAVAGLASEQLLSPARGRTARVAAADARIDARRVDLDATRRELESRLRILTAERGAVADRLAAARAATEANRANLEMARDQFQAGRRSLIELLDAEREALASERQRILAEHDRAVLGYAILAATGDILDVFAVTLPTPTISGQASQ